MRTSGSTRSSAACRCLIPAVADVICAPDWVGVAQRRGAAAALPILLVVGEVAAALHAADRTKDGLRRWPSVDGVAPHAVGTAVLGVVGKRGELAVGGERADQRTTATAASATVGLYLAIDLRRQVQ